MKKKIEKNRFGYRMGTGAQLLSEEVDEEPRTVAELSRRAGNPRDAEREHFEHMRKNGFVEKVKQDGEIRYRLIRGVR